MGSYSDRVKPSTAIPRKFGPPMGPPSRNITVPQGPVQEGSSSGRDKSLLLSSSQPSTTIPRKPLLAGGSSNHDKSLPLPPSGPVTAFPQGPVPAVSFSSYEKPLPPPQAQPSQSQVSLDSVFSELYASPTPTPILAPLYAPASIDGNWEDNLPTPTVDGPLPSIPGYPNSPSIDGTSDYDHAFLLTKTKES